MNKEEIEELAFKDRKELANLNELDLLEIIEFLQNDRKQWINQFTQTHNESIDIQKENKLLKKQLEEWGNHLKCSKEMLDIQGQKGNYDYDEYMLGLYNGMEYIIALFETREPNYISGKDVKFTNNKTQQKEFIEYLENEKDRLARECSQIYEDSLGKTRLVNEDIFNEVNDVLQKYKSIIGVSNENNIK